MYVYIHVVDPSMKMTMTMTTMYIVKLLPPQAWRPILPLYIFILIHRSILSSHVFFKLQHILTNEIITLNRRLPAFGLGITAQVANMRRALHERESGVDAMFEERGVRALRLLPGDQIVIGAVDQKGRGLVFPADDVG